MDNAIKRKPKYEVLEYLQSSWSGQPTINTNYYPSLSYFRLDLKFSVLSYNWFDDIFGAYKDNFRYLNMELQRNNSFVVFNGNQNVKVAYSLDTIYDYSFIDNNGTFSLYDNNTGSLITSSSYSGSSASEYAFGLFGMYYPNDDRWIGSNINIYSAKMYSSETTLVRDYVPAKRILDGALGLYDKVHNKFYENAGTGTFIGGNTIGKIIY